MCHNDGLKFRKVSEVNEVNQRLKFWAGVAIIVSLRPLATHMYSWTLWTIHHYSPYTNHGRGKEN